MRKGDKGGIDKVRRRDGLFGAGAAFGGEGNSLDLPGHYITSGALTFQSGLSLNHVFSFRSSFLLTH